MDFINVNSVGVLSQRLAEAAEDADYYHEYNETLEACYCSVTFVSVCDCCSVYKCKEKCDSAHWQLHSL